jgi:ankyrin repeat protein
VVALLLAKGAKRNLRDRNGMTPLESAAHGRHADVIELLMDPGVTASAASSDSAAPTPHAGRHSVVGCSRRTGSSSGRPA